VVHNNVAALMYLGTIGGLNAHKCTQDSWQHQAQLESIALQELRTVNALRKPSGVAGI